MNHPAVDEVISKVDELFRNENYCDGDEFICRLVERIQQRGSEVQFTEEETNRVMLYHEEMSSGVWLDFIGAQL